MAWSPLTQLVTVEQFKNHLKLPTDNDAEDVDLELKLQIAHELVIDYVDQRLGDDASDWSDTVAAWTSDTAPKRVLAAILYQAAELYRFRGDEDRPDRVPGQLSPDVVTLLYRLRDPAVS